MAKRKPDIITFKVDDSLLGAMKGIPNRSEFIRTAILSALDSVCPLCRGSGIMTPNQRKHWKALSLGHFVKECSECHELSLVCAYEKTERAHKGERSPGGSRGEKG